MTYQDYINCSREALLEKMASFYLKTVNPLFGCGEGSHRTSPTLWSGYEKAGLAGFFMTMLRSYQIREFLDLIDPYQLDP